jgi:hypothetical protein
MMMKKRLKLDASNMKDDGNIGELGGKPVIILDGYAEVLHELVRIKISKQYL